ncbi:hypothetical protein TUM12151_32030 [Morganella morganii]|uniref:hypothetical protein n=1 Tax=Morganella TaxID=581 RepID=UPI001C7CE74D|nr:hypothetical protein [Morganella morganii]ELA7737182.1 hypothetical protein [Morganella morganii]GIZ28615.1 hypothetical protein TUM12149_25850 [Morganella morganii]GIZ32558.1 hypothetical protein TUM12150_30440 [Morganella morganii]GIZ36217.1 hypothetical protein TUM12151_32030 [Morganella morganii]HCR3195401.1 hypothetical protein [Morganella morganii]
MNQLDIYLKQDDVKDHHQKKQRFKLVYIDEVVHGSFLITEFCNGEVRHYTQKSGEQPVLNNTQPYSSSDSFYPSLAIHIYASAIGDQP